MHINAKFYTPEILNRAKHVQIAIITLAAVFCGYMIVTTAMASTSVWDAEGALRRARLENKRLTSAAEDLQRKQLLLPRATQGGIEDFALQMDKWAKEKGLTLQSITPEGMPLETNVKLDNAELGKWTANSVRVAGSGPFSGAVSLFNEFLTPLFPLQVQSLKMQSDDNKENVSFEFVIMVYEKKV